MTKPFLKRYTNGFTYREHNKAISVIRDERGYMLQFIRVIEPSELPKEFENTALQYVFTKCGISLLVSRIPISESGLFALGVVVGSQVELNQETAYEFSWKPETHEEANP